MSDRAKVSTSHLGLVLCLFCLAGALAQGQVVVAPTNVNFTYVQGAALPAAQKVAVKTGSGTPVYSTAIVPTGATGSALWLTATPDTGVLPANVNFRVNPTGLETGTYTAAVGFTAVGVAAPGTTNVTLLVTAPPPTLTASVPALNFTTVLGVSTPPAAQTLQLSTSGSPISYTASLGTAIWLTVAPANGLILPGAPITLTVMADPTTLAPAALSSPYKAKITITATGAANKTQTIPVTFTVIYQTPTLSSIWPPNALVGGPATTVTIRGTNFASATVAKVLGTPNVALKTTYYSPTVISAVIPAPQLVAGTPLTIIATNPAPGGDSASTVTLTFGQSVDAAVNAASYAPGASPGDLITLFGQNIGPPIPASLTETVPGIVDTTLGGFTVTIDGIAAPMIYASQNQISVQVPYGVSIGAAKPIVVTNGSITANGTVDTALTSPGIFTVDSSGTGQAAALNQNGTFNSASNAEKIGRVVTFYLTGEGDYSATPPSTNGFVMTTAALAALWPSQPASPYPMNPPPTVTIGGNPATVQYAGPFVGGLLGILQLNVTIPAGATGPAVPILVTIGGQTTQAGVTIATKP